MPDPISVILELTESEASALRSLLLRGADWQRSGEFGEAIESIYDALDAVVGISSLSYEPMTYNSRSYSIWRKI